MQARHNFREPAQGFHDVFTSQNPKYPNQSPNPTQASL